MKNPTEKITRVKLWTKAYEKAGKPVNGVVTAILITIKPIDHYFLSYLLHTTLFYL